MLCENLFYYEIKDVYVAKCYVCVCVCVSSTCKTAKEHVGVGTFYIGTLHTEKLKAQINDNVVSNLI